MNQNENQWDRFLKIRERYCCFFIIHRRYISYLMMEEQLMFYDEIDTSDLFPGEDKRERIMIFEVIL